MTLFDIAKEWLRYAKGDLTTAKHMFSDVYPKEIEISCYHAHQCAEKALNAFLISKAFDAPRIHDLVELNKLCEAHEKDFSDMQQNCASLNLYGVHVRYPNELAIDEIMAKQAMDYAEKVYMFCENIIENCKSQYV